MTNDNAQSGFTLMETLIALGVVSLVMIILSLALSSSAGAMQKARDNALFGIQLLRADSLIRNRIGAVAVPYWETPAMETGESSVTIPWHRGEREGYVRLRAGEGALVMETGDKEGNESIALLSGLEGIELSILRNEEGVPYGVGVSCSRGQKSYHILSAFASIPLARGLPSTGGISSAGGILSEGGLPSAGGIPSEGGAP
jgi:prepilin-type N-terminal cleavage/methylation domain-containing protein